MISRELRLRLSLVLWTLASGCYLHHVGEPNGTDAGGLADAAHDAHLDAGADAEAQVDAAVDARSDASGEGGDVDATIDHDAGPRRDCFVPADYPTLQSALDDSSCDPIFVTEEQQVTTVLIARDVTITTPSEGDHVVVRGDGSGSVVIVQAQARVTLERLSITGGVAGSLGGGGIRSEGDLTLSDLQIIGNRVEQTLAASGGGLHQVGGRLHMTGEITFEENVAGDTVASAASGGALFVNSEVTIDGEVTFFGNRAMGERASGGAIFMYGGSLDGSDMHFESNVALASCVQPFGFAQASGGAIGGTGTVTLIEPTFTSNEANAGALGTCSAIASGGAVAVDATISGGSGTLNNARASIEGNAVAYAQGGFMAGNALLEDMVISSNSAMAIGDAGSTALAHGGGFYCTRCGMRRMSIRSNRAFTSVPGVIADPSGPQFSINPPFGPLGGGIWTQHLEIFDSSLSRNVAELWTSGEYQSTRELAGGGGLALMANNDTQGDDFVIRRTSITENRATTLGARSDVLAVGGGIFIEEGPSDVVIISSTIADNSLGALEQALIPTGGACGGGIAVVGTPMSFNPANVLLFNATLAGNRIVGTNVSAPSICRTSTTSNPITIHNSILWDNTIGENADACCSDCLTGTHNMVDPTCIGQLDTTNLTSNPQLSALAPITMGCEGRAILLTSPAHNAGNQGGCFSPPDEPNVVDQCGRPREGNCDIGALEATQ